MKQKRHTCGATVIQNKRVTLAQALAQLGVFIRSLYQTLRTGAVPTNGWSGRRKFFSETEFGGLWLSDVEVEEFANLVSVIHSILPNRELISVRTVEKLAERAILESVNLKSFGSRNFEEDLQGALSKLREKLVSKPTEYEVLYPVNGMSREGLPARVGRVNFLVFDEKEKTRFLNIIQNSSKSEKTKMDYASVLQKMWEEGAENQVFASTTVSAVDYASARLLAIPEIRRCVDSLNFFTDLIPYNYAELSLPAELSTAQVISPVLGSSLSNPMEIKYTIVGSVGEISVQQFREFAQAARVFDRVSELLAKKRSKLEEALIAALQWAGRATVERRTEEAFLLYVIALESLLLSDSDKQELGYRLRLRLAYLLGSEHKNRSKIANEMKALYDTRSSIVHSGNAQVTDAELIRVRLYAKGVIFCLLTEEPFISMNTPKELADWFDRRILGAEQ